MNYLYKATTALKATASLAAALFQTESRPLLALLGQLHLEGLPSAKVKSPLATI
jgi:hypothetical protein